LASFDPLRRMQYIFHSGACTVTSGSRHGLITAILGTLGVSLLNAGCGGADVPDNLTSVFGVVTLDGQPLAGAAVTFVPPDGRPASGTTDSSGAYSLSYNDGSDGCLPGLCRVMISTGTAGRENDDGEVVGAKPESVPPKYNVQSELTFDVKLNERNQADFSLTGALPASPVNPTGDTEVPVDTE
jgi:hypothetical protein